jgi:hypothetical protein
MGNPLTGIVKLGEIPYSEFPTISFNAQESIEMPFRKSLPFASRSAGELWSAR